MDLHNTHTVKVSVSPAQMGFLGLWIVALAVILGGWSLFLADRWPSDAAPTIVVNETAATPTELSDEDQLGILLEEESNK